MNVHIPLELVSDEYGELDKMQTKLIKKYGALDLVLLENANELSALGSYHGAEADKSWEQISDEKEAWKKQRLGAGGDTIMNPSDNHFEERPGLIFHQEEDAVVTHTEVEQKEIDQRVFNRNRQ